MSGFVSLVKSVHFSFSLCLNDQACNCLIHFNKRDNYDVMSYDEMEDNLWWKTTFDGRQPLMEDDLWWKTTFDWRRPLMKDDRWLKTTFDGGQPFMEDDPWWNMTFNGRRPLMEDTLGWKMTIDRRWHSCLHSQSRTYYDRIVSNFFYKHCKYICWYIFCLSIKSLIFLLSEMKRNSRIWPRGKDHTCIPTATVS